MVNICAPQSAMFCLESGFWPNCSPSLPVAGGQVSSSSLTCPPSTYSFLRANLLLLLQIYRADRRTPKPVAAAAAAKAAAAPTLNSFHPSAALRPTGPSGDGRGSGCDEPQLPEAEVVSSSGEGGERSLPLERRSGTFLKFPSRHYAPPFPAMPLVEPRAP